MIGSAWTAMFTARERSNDMPVTSPGIAPGASRFSSAIGPGLVTSKKLHEARTVTPNAPETRRIIVMIVIGRFLRRLPVHSERNGERAELREYVVLAPSDLTVGLIRGLGVEARVVRVVEQVAPCKRERRPFHATEQARRNLVAHGHVAQAEEVDRLDPHVGELGEAIDR